MQNDELVDEFGLRTEVGFGMNEAGMMSFVGGVEWRAKATRNGLAELGTQVTIPNC